jgi:hypothetical protein
VPSNDLFSLSNGSSPGGSGEKTAAADAPTYSSVMLIEEIAPPDGGVTPRTLTLEGSALPHWGASWPIKQKVVTTWYPGNQTEASQQVLVAQDMPSSWDGEWRATMMRRAPSHWSQGGASQAIINPFQLYILIESMIRGGLPWRVTWAQDGTPQQTGKIVRIGRVTDFEPKITRVQDIEWSMTLEWAGRGDRTPKAVSVRDDTAAALTALAAIKVSAFVATHNKYISAILDAQGNSTYKGASNFTLGQLEQLAKAPSAMFDGINRQFQNVITQLNQLQRIGQTALAQPFQIANAAINTAKSAVAVALQTADAYGRTPPELMSLNTNAADMLRAHYIFGSLQDAMQDALEAMQAAVTVLRRQRAPVPLGGFVDPKLVRANVSDVLAVYVTKPGDTPDRVSARFYKTPDNGDIILKANDLPEYLATFAPGFPLMIPNLSNSTQPLRQ